MNTWKTPAGKEIGLRLANNTSLWEVEFKSGGQLPKELGGMYTNTASAAMAIEKYLGKKNINAKNKTTPTSK